MTKHSINIYDPGDLEPRLRRIAEAESILKNDKAPSISGAVLWLVEQWEAKNLGISTQDSKLKQK